MLAARAAPTTSERLAAASTRLRRLGVRVGGGGAGLLATLPPDHPAPVGVKALGGFRVLREGTLSRPRTGDRKRPVTSSRSSLPIVGTPSPATT